jgi:hypothetical protein
MSISAVISNSPLNGVNNLQNAKQKQRAEFQELTQALQSGNLTHAQQAFQSLTGSANKVASLQSAQLTQELKALGTALQSGSPASAGNAYTAASQNTQTPARTAHHHHHYGGDGSPALTSGFPDGSSGSGLSTTNPTGLLQAVNLTA